MSFQRWLYLVLAAALLLIVLLFVRMHSAAAQGAAGAAKGDAEAGRLIAQAWCTECHSVQRETAGTGTFVPDFTVIARQRSAPWLHTFLHTPHARMPAFKFERKDAEDLVAYIVSLKNR
jgi:mono/diheme cytochrome c family protein